MVCSASVSKQEEHRVLVARESEQARAMQEGPGVEGDGVGGRGGWEVPASSLVHWLRQQRRLPGDAADGGVACGEGSGDAPPVPTGSSRTASRRTSLLP